MRGSVVAGLIICWLLIPLLAPAQQARDLGEPKAQAQSGSPAKTLLQRHVTAGAKCASCHGDAPKSMPVSDAACLSCHGPLQSLEAKTAADMPNPHAQAHIGPIPCTACHHIHRPSELYCNKCHSYDMAMP